MVLFGELDPFLRQLTADTKDVLPPYPSSRRLKLPTSSGEETDS